MIGSVRFVVDKRDSYEHGNVSQQEAAGVGRGHLMMKHKPDGGGRVFYH